MGLIKCKLSIWDVRFLIKEVVNRVLLRVGFI